MKEVLHYFSKQHSTTNVTALDISKAFDKVNHFVLFNKLLDRSVPVCLVKVLVCWYDKCSAETRWSNAVSRVFIALHEMQTRSSDENSVRPSVRLSVCQTRVS